MGNVARWIDGDFQALSNNAFSPHPLYEEFSHPWFRGDHSVMLGASFASLGHMGQAALMRDFMQNHMDQLSGITLVRPED